MPTPQRMHNRVSGVVGATKNHEVAPAVRPTVEARVNHIAPALAGLVVPIDSLVVDPDNARLHPERNLQAVRESLCLYGQMKPIVVQRSTGIVAAGNGTLECARALGWTQIAATVVEMSDEERRGYGLADNRTAELARWDFEVVSRLQRLQAESGHGTTGWSDDELEVLRAAEWVPPSVEDIDLSNGGRGKPIQVSFQQREKFDVVVDLVRRQRGDKKLDEGTCLEIVIKEYSLANS